ncbi:MAG: glycosyltransferase family 39 protein [Acidimicrobiales bacterium]
MDLLRRVGDGFWRVSDGALLGTLTLLALVLRVPRLGIRYWGDEAISVGIASRPLDQIPHFLRFDGSPPLYYVVLHMWMAAFGTSELATHSLSLVISLSAIPAAWWCAKEVLGPATARPAALIASVFPYLTYYGTETRMYVLVGTLSMVAVAAWAQALRAPSDRRWLALAVVASAAVLYTHNWGLYLVGACTFVGLVRARAGGDRAVLRASVTYAGAVGLAYLPWVPSLWWQVGNTGAPWAPRPSVGDLVADPVNAAFSASWVVVVACLLVAVRAMWVASRTGNEGTGPGRSATGPHRGLTGPGRSRPGGSRVAGAGRLGNPLAVLALVVVVVIVAGWLVAQVVHSWAPRYLGVALLPAVLAMAGVLAASAMGRRCLPVVALAMAATALPVMLDPPAAAASKSNVATVDAAMSGQLVPGDLVITTAVAELPAIAYYLPPGLRYATPIGLVSDPRIVDWQDLPARLSAADPTTGLADLLASVPAGGHVLLVDPLRWGGTETPPRYEGTVAAEGIAASNDVLGDPAYTVVRTIRPPDKSAVANPVEGILFRKTG